MKEESRGHRKYPRRFLRRMRIWKLVAVGMMNYDENYVITWQSGLWEREGTWSYWFLSELRAWLPEANDIISGNGKVNVQIDQYVYEVSKRENANDIHAKNVHF